jgi:long-chain acyl-CoA synthetase
MVGGGTIALDLAREAEALFECHVYAGYGTTESGPVSTFRRVESDADASVVGKIMPHLAYRFVDETGAIAERGELHLKVPESVRGTKYLNAEGPYDEDGWIATGDVGHIRDDGSFQLTGRVSEFINAGGTKMEPGYFEGLARRIAGVRDAAAFAVSNVWGSEDVGLLLVVDGSPNSASLRTGLDSAIRRGFAFRIFFADTIPSSQRGKVDRRQLGALYREKAPAVTAP